MKHKYSKLAISVYYFATAVGFIIFVWFLSLFSHNATKFCIISFFICCSGFVLDYKYRGHRYVEFFDEHMRLNSFPVREKRNWFSFSIRYEDIYSIESKKLPILGIWNIVLRSNNFDCKINISFCFYKHTDMFITICERAKNANPNVYIDDNLRLFLERNKK